MYTKLMVTLFMLIAGSVSYAQYDDEYEVVERNVSRSADEDAGEGSVQEDYSKSKMDAYDTKNSPQINIYNANSNANKQNQKAKQEAEALADAEAAANSKAKNENSSEFGAEYVARANDLRRSRKDMEVGTEQRMIEKIEYSRMEDEKDRANRLFGNRLDKKYDNDYNNEYQKPQPQVIVVEKKPEYTAPVAPVYAGETKAEESTSLFGQESYIAPMIGTMNTSASNVRTDSVMGVAIGNRFDTNVSVEGSFLYTSAEMEDYTLVAGQDEFGENVPGLKTVDQYSLGLGVKYNFDAGRVSPFVGALAAYTWRDYTEARATGEATDSNAVDAGVNVGLDVKLAKNFSIGAEYRWMRNVWYDRSEPDLSNVEFDYPTIDKGSLEALEDAGFSAFLVNGKFTF